MSDLLVVPVILSGGSGTRLWPMSRPEQPKQLLALTGDETMLQQTAQRTADPARFASPIVVANAQHSDAVEGQLAAIGIIAQSLILEPAGRNSAPAIALAAIAAGGGEAPILVMPSDHVINDGAAFQAAIDAALPLARDGWLITFGIDAHAPETGYGWIKRGDAIAAGVNKVAQFVEKPPLDRAQAMLASGDHYWNGGIFLFRADAYLAALALHAPAMLAACQQAMDGASIEGKRVFPDAVSFAACPADSVDYAVMEKAARVAVVPVSMGWSDVGSWDALHAIHEKDAAGNSSKGGAVLLDTTGTLVHSDGIRLHLIGMTDVIVVASGNDVLIMPRGRSQEVKALQALLNKA